MVIVLYALAVVVLVGGAVISLLAPTEFLGAREALYARLIFLAPALLVALLLMALGAVLAALGRLERHGAEVAGLLRQWRQSEVAAGIGPALAAAEPVPPLGAAFPAAAGAGALAGAAFAPDAAAAPPREAAEFAFAPDSDPDAQRLPEPPAAVPEPSLPVAYQPEAQREHRWSGWRSEPRLDFAGDHGIPASPAADPDSQAARVAAALEAVLVADRTADQPGERGPAGLRDAFAGRDLDLPPEPEPPLAAAELRLEDLLDEPVVAAGHDRAAELGSLALEDALRPESSGPDGNGPQETSAYNGSGAAFIADAAPEPQPIPVPAPAPAAAPYIAPAVQASEEPVVEAAADDAQATAEPPAEVSAGRAPTVAEYIAREDAEAEPTPPPTDEPAPRILREGQFAGRRYRMFENGSLEIDTDQSTIRFGSLDEFRSFVASSARRS